MDFKAAAIPELDKALARARDDGFLSSFTYLLREARSAQPRSANGRVSAPRWAYPLGRPSENWVPISAAVARRAKHEP